MSISPFDLLVLLGSLQGFILAALLGLNPEGNCLSNRLLAWLMGLLALASLAVSIPIVNRWVGLALDLAPLINAMPVGPLIFFYTKSLLDPTFRLGRIERLHFYPVLLDWGAKFIGWTFVAGWLLGVLREEDGPGWGAVMNEYNTYSDIPRWLSLAIYVVLAKQWLARYAPTAKGQEAQAQQQNVRWLRQFLSILLVFLALWLVHLVAFINPGTRLALLDRFGWYPIYIPIAGMIYWLGLKGYLHSRRNAAVFLARKAGTTPIASETADPVVDALTRAMKTDKLYLDPELTVERVSQHVRLPPKTISSVLNQHLGKTFNTFVNEYRIEAVKQRLLSPDREHLTLTGIALECGFNSRATFQRVFKQMTGVSPKEFGGRMVEES